MSGGTRSTSFGRSLIVEDQSLNGCCPNLKENSVIDKVLKRLNDVPDRYKKNYEKAMTGKNRAAAVKAFCLECVTWQREEVKLCTAPACPLFPYRPYKKEEELVPQNSEKKVRKGGFQEGHKIRRNVKTPK